MSEIRLIDANALRKQIVDCEYFNSSFLKMTVAEFLTIVDGIIDNAPTVCGNNPKWCESCVSKGKCASTRPQGEWIKNQVAFYQGCIECGAYVRSSTEEVYLDPRPLNFCPCCGADMRGKKIQTPSCLMNPERHEELLERYKEGEYGES